MLEVLGLPGARNLLEVDLERALLDNLQQFLLEPGRGFAFIALPHGSSRLKWREIAESRFQAPQLWKRALP